MSLINQILVRIIMKKVHFYLFIIKKLSVTKLSAYVILILYVVSIITIGYYLHIIGCPDFECNCFCRNCVTPKPNHSSYYYYGNRYYNSNCYCSECTRSQHCPPCKKENKEKCDICRNRLSPFFLLSFFFYVILSILSLVLLFRFLS